MSAFPPGWFEKMGIKPKWRRAFQHFANTGEADQDFLDYVDGSESMQRAVEDAFHIQAAPIKGLAKALARLTPEAPDA